MSDSMKKQDAAEVAKNDLKSTQPVVDIIELSDDYIVRADIAGVKPEDINVSLDRDILTLQARSEVDGLSPRLYARKFRVMRGIDADKIRADYKDGVLTLKLAKPVENKPQKIQIQCN